MIRRMMMAGLKNGSSEPVYKSWSIDLGGEFSNPPEGETIVWNLFYPNASQMGTPNGKTISNMVTEDNQASTLSLTNQTAFEGFSNGYANYVSTEPVYPKTVVDSGMSLYGDRILRIGGADITKTYQIRLLSAVTDSNCATSISSGSEYDERISTNNYPADGDDRYESPALLKLNGLVPNSSGEIELTIGKTGSFYQTAINMLIIREEQ